MNLVFNLEVWNTDGSLAKTQFSCHLYRETVTPSSTQNTEKYPLDLPKNEPPPHLCVRRGYDETNHTPTTEWDEASSDDEAESTGRSSSWDGWSDQEHDIPTDEEDEDYVPEKKKRQSVARQNCQRYKLRAANDDYQPPDQSVPIPQPPQDTEEI